MNHLKALRSLAIALPFLAVAARAEVVTAAFDSAATVPITAAGYLATGNRVEFALNFTPPVDIDASPASTITHGALTKAMAGLPSASPSD